MIISAFHICRVASNNSVVATVDITLNENFVINSIRLLQKENKLFMAMPSRKNIQGNYHDIVFPVNQSVRSAMEELLYAGYRQAVKEDKQNLYFYRIESLAENRGDFIQLQTFQNFQAANFFRSDNNESGKNELNITDVKIHPVKNSKLRAVCTVLLENELVIQDIKLITKNNGEMLLVMPSYQAKASRQFKNIAYPVNAATRVHLEQCIFQAYKELPDELTGGAEHSQLLTDYEDLNEPNQKLFRILWDASDNGYILQSRIPSILQRYDFDWQQLFQVATVTELVQRMDFLKIKKLEPKPNTFVNWVVVSTQKEISPIVENTENRIELSEEILAGIYKILYESSKDNGGNMLMSEVVPALQKGNPDLFDALPKTKISIILEACDFVEQYIIRNDETNIQIWIHIRLIQGRMDETWCDDSLKIADEFQNDVIQEICPEDENSVSANKQKNSPQKDETGKVIVAQNNPFQYIPNSVFWPEHRVVQNGVGVRDNNLAVKNLGIALRSGNVGRFELDVLSWITKLVYVKNTMVLDLIRGGYIKAPSTFNITLQKVGDKLLRMYKYNLVDIYRLASIDDDGRISSKSMHRIYTITNYGHNQLKDIGRESAYNPFVVLQDADTIKQRLSLNQWLIKWITCFSEYINRYLLNKVLVAKIPMLYAARINAIVECNFQPVFAMPVRRGNDWNYARKSGEFSNKIQRIKNLILHYTDIFYDNQNAEFVKKPVFTIIGEDIEHCREIFHEIEKFIDVPGKQGMLAEIWFCCDLDVYNNFVYSHFTFDESETYIPVNLYEKLDILESNVTPIIVETEENESL